MCRCCCCCCCYNWLRDTAPDLNVIQKNSKFQNASCCSGRPRDLLQQPLQAAAAAAAAAVVDHRGPPPMQALSAAIAIVVSVILSYISEIIDFSILNVDLISNSCFFSRGTARRQRRRGPRIQQEAPIFSHHLLLLLSVLPLYFLFLFLIICLLSAAAPQLQLLRQKAAASPRAILCASPSSA